MEKEKWNSLLIDYIDGKLTEEERLHVEAELKVNIDVLKLYEQLKMVVSQLDNQTEVQPTTKLRFTFENTLQQEIENSKSSNQVFFHPMVLRIAAGVALIMIGVGIGFWINKNNLQQQEIARLRSEMDSTKYAMMAMLTNQQSASQRMLAATVAYQMPSADDEIVNALVRAMNEDSNTNVRLAALEALSKFLHQAHVRGALIKSLAKQKDPVVQISLIQLLVKMKEKSVVNELERMTKEKGLLPAVKDEAHAGILKLS